MLGCVQIIKSKQCSVVFCVSLDKFLVFFFFKLLDCERHFCSCARAAKEGFDSNTIFKCLYHIYRSISQLYAQISPDSGKEANHGRFDDIFSGFPSPVSLLVDILDPSGRRKNLNREHLLSGPFKPCW